MNSQTSFDDAPDFDVFAGGSHRRDEDSCQLVAYLNSQFDVIASTRRVNNEFVVDNISLGFASQIKLKEWKGLPVRIARPVVNLPRQRTERRPFVHKRAS